MNKAQTLILLIAGAVFTSASQINIPSLAPFSVAFAGLGYALAALARSETLWNPTPPTSPPPPPATIEIKKP